MGARETGPTLEGLAKKLEAQAQRLETLERENERMRSENAELRGKKMAAPTGPEENESGLDYFADEERVSRRALLTKAGVAAVAAVAAGTLLRSREAQATVTTFNDTVRVRTENDKNRTDIGNPDFAAAVSANNEAGGDGVSGLAHDSSAAGVYGYNFDGDGVKGGTNTNDYSGVYGEHTGTVGYGIAGDGKGESGAGVLGRNQDGTGVHGKSSKTGYGAITAEHTGTSGYGVVGLGTGPSAGVLGRNNSGYGGQFEGGKAQLKLKPGTSAGKPTTGTHTKGEIYMDKAGALFVCTAGEGTTVGTWKKLTMKPV